MLTTTLDAQGNFKYATNEYDGLTVHATTPEYRSERNCVYDYLIRNRATSYTAFKTRTDFVQWLAERQMLDAVEIPKPNSGETTVFKRALRETCHIKEADIPHTWAKPFFKMENARYMLAYCFIDDDGVSNVHYANCNDIESIQVSPARNLQLNEQ